MLEVANLACVRGDRRLFQGVGFRLGPGELLHVHGANGSGKTSLLRILAGLSGPEQGEVRWQGQNIRALREDYARVLVYLGHLAAIKDELTALENVRVGMHLAGAPVGEAQALAALRRLGLQGKEELQAKVLSQGQRRRVALARLLLSQDSRLWVLDEPFNALDSAAVVQLQGILAQHLERGGMVVLTTHQEVEITAAATQRLQLDALP